MWAGYKILSFQSFFFGNLGGFSHIILVSAAPLETFGFILAPHLSSPDISRASCYPTWHILCDVCSVVHHLEFIFLNGVCAQVMSSVLGDFLSFFLFFVNFHYFTVILDFEYCSFCIFHRTHGLWLLLGTFQDMEVGSCLMRWGAGDTHRLWGLHTPAAPWGWWFSNPLGSWAWSELPGWLSVVSSVPTAGVFLHSWPLILIPGLKPLEILLPVNLVGIIMMKTGSKESKRHRLCSWQYPKGAGSVEEITF